MNETKKFMPVQLTAKNILTFAIPALIGAFIFLCPMSANGTSGIVVGIILTTVSNAIISYNFYRCCADVYYFNYYDTGKSIQTEFYL